MGRAVAVSLLALAFGNATPHVSEVNVHLKNLPREADGKSLVQISDLHVGSLVGLQNVRRLVWLINSLDPDLVVITGDLVDEHPSKLEACGKILFP